MSAASLAILPSCHKKDEDSETDPFLNGTVSFSIPSFVKVGEQLTVTPKGAVNPTGNVGYYWSSTWNSTRDTVKTESGSGDGTWTMTVPLATGVYTVTVGAFAENYSSISSYKKFTVVDPSLEGSLKGAGYETGSSLVDSRDNGVYYLTTAGDKVWMQNNLYYSGSGVSYENSVAMDPIVGRFYTWNEAVTACPEGWRLPTDKEFSAMTGSTTTGETLSNVAGSLMVNATFNGQKLWTFWPDVKITNSAKFSAIPIGYAVDQEGYMKYMGSSQYATFWTSDNSDDSAIYRYIYVAKNDIYLGYGDKESFRASVRCVKDDNNGE